jgi:hypothetical protein
VTSTSEHEIFLNLYTLQKNTIHLEFQFYYYKVLDKISTRAVASMVVTALTAFEKKNRLLGMRYD